MGSESFHEQDAKKIIEITGKRWGWTGPVEKAKLFEVMATQALRGLVKIMGIDHTMCFLWPIMEKLNAELEKQTPGVGHDKAANQ